MSERASSNSGPLSAAEPVRGPDLDFSDPHSPLAPIYLRNNHVALVLALLPVAFLFTAITLARLWHTDVWGHLRFGESIVLTRSLPQREAFSGPLADQDAPYVNFQWLSQAAFYLAFDAGRRASAADAEHLLGGGALMLSTLHALVVALRFVILLAAFHRLTSSWGGAAVGVLLAAGMSVFSHLFILRPQIFGEVLFALVLLALSRPIISKRAVLGLPLVFVVWANAHGSFLAGLTLLGLALAGEVLAQGWSWFATRRQGGPRCGSLVATLWREPRVARLAVTLLLCLAASALLNPHGPALYLHSLELSRHPNIRFMEEWKPLPLGSPAGIAFLLSVGLLLLLAVVGRSRPTVTQVLLLVVFGWQTLAHGRMIVWWIMIFAWIATPQLYTVYRCWMPAQPISEPSLRKTVLAAMCGALVGLVLLCSGPAQWLCFGRAPLGSRRVTAVTPVEAARYLRAQYEGDTQGKLRRVVFCSETLGDYLLWDLRLKPPVRLSCYTHVHLLEANHWLECVRVKMADPDWQEILDRQRAQFLILEYDLYQRDRGFSPLIDRVRAAPSRWQVVTESPVFVARRREQ